MRLIRSIPSALFLCALGLLAGATVTAFVRTHDETHAASQAQIDQLRDELLALQTRVDAVERPSPPAKLQPRLHAGRPDPAAVYAVPVGDSPILGRADAPITIVEFVDYQCPFCRRVQGTLEKVRERYGDDVRIVFKHNPLPFHRRAEPAAQAAICAHQQERFWAMSTRLWEQGDQKFPGSLEDPDLRSAAVASRLNMAAFDKCVSGLGGTRSGTLATAALDRDKSTAATFGAKGTPAFFINGRFLSGARPLESFAKLIDEELAKAKASGIPSGQYYASQVMGPGLAGVD